MIAGEEHVDEDRAGSCSRPSSRGSSASVDVAQRHAGHGRQRLTPRVEARRMAAGSTISAAPDTRAAFAHQPAQRVDVHVGLQAHAVVDQRRDRHVARPAARPRAPRPAPCRPAPTPRISPSICDSTSPSGGSDMRAARPIDDAVQRAASAASPVIASVRDAGARRAGAPARRASARRPSRRADAPPRAPRAPSAARRSVTVTSCRIAATNCCVDQHVHRVDERRGRRAAPRRRTRCRATDAQRAHGLALEVAQDHPRGHASARSGSHGALDEARAGSAPAARAASPRPAACAPRGAPPTARRAPPRPGCRRATPTATSADSR